MLTPRLLRWTATIVLLCLLLMTLFRIGFYAWYRPAGSPFPGDAFLMGFRLDLRIASILGILVLLLAAIPWLSPFRSRRAAKAWRAFLTLLFLVLVLTYIIDFFHFDYLKQRLSASVLSLVQDVGISLSMAWESYPVITVLLILIGLVAGIYVLLGRVLRKVENQPPVASRKAKWLYLPFVLILALFTWGTLGQFALRWSDVFTLQDPFRAQLALNPVQSFVSTLSFRTSTYDAAKVKKAYPLMARYLGLPQADSAGLRFARQLAPQGPIPFSQRPNVVLVICESFSAYKSSMWGNPLNPTPYFDSLSRKGIFFDHCFTPSYGTARGIWAVITGTPDVEFPKTASRNPDMVDQHTILNDFTDYEKFYFIGGSASWANIRGLLEFNIKGLKLYEQEDYNAEKVDVWGISDKNVFLQANTVLAGQQKPFFAIIQTADNHRPYTIPEEDRKSFRLLSLPADTLKKYGYDNHEELNAFRYTDYCFRTFMEAAQKQPYFQNTVFVFIGDHGLRGDASAIFPKAWTEQALTNNHVPLLFYSPLLTSPSRRSNICSQLDVLPSIAGLVSRPHRNTTLGRNLFDSALTRDPFRGSGTFINNPDEKEVGFIAGDHLLFKGRDKASYEVFSLRSNSPVPPGPLTDSLHRTLAPYADAFFETARYLLYHNRK